MHPALDTRHHGYPPQEWEKQRRLEEERKQKEQREKEEQQRRLEQEEYRKELEREREQDLAATAGKDFQSLGAVNNGHDGALGAARSSGATAAGRWAPQQQFVACGGAAVADTSAAALEKRAKVVRTIHSKS